MMRFVRINILSWILLCIISVAADPSRGSIGFYADSSCREQVNNAQDVAAGVCVNTNGVIAVAAGSLPSCGHTTAVLYISDIAGCMDPSFLPIVSSGHVGDCLSFIEGRLIDSAHFQCTSSTGGIGNTTSNTPGYTTGSPPGGPLPSDDPPGDESGSGGGDLSLGSILGIAFGLSTVEETSEVLKWVDDWGEGRGGGVFAGETGALAPHFHVPWEHNALAWRQDLSTSQGSLMLFTDECCYNPISESSVPLISGDCQGAPFPGIRGVVLTSLPTCPDYGLPLLIVSNETSCKNPQSESNANSGVLGRCQSFVVNEISSFQFVCYGKGVSSLPLPSTTTNWQWSSTSPTTASAQSETQWTPISTWVWSETEWTPTSTWTQSETQWTPTSTWGWRWTYETGPTLIIMPTGKDTKDTDADVQSWVTLAVTMNNTVYEVRQPTAEYDIIREESRDCSGGDTVSRRDGAPVLVCLMTIWLLISLL
ncbi:hypothetical protein E0Z10_g10386 [Xylaria hypoxylon]|uniref:Ig-like domain-containing protein n=1 Tax=Xylaria hypoxylon TaxID=37992 RepID=A0A4Z0Y348_9PEZI|nr:hypothetical protein E0Z10_g10386 [Xylaria hypoxylon]